MPTGAPTYDCPECGTAEWTWHEYWNQTGWMCADCRDVIVLADYDSLSAEGDSR